MPKVGVALAAIVVVTVDAGVARQAPVVGLVWHSLRLTGKLAVFGVDARSQFSRGPSPQVNALVAISSSELSRRGRRRMSI
jgi:hypothetical protein